MQNRLPATSRASTRAPRKWIQVSRVARFRGASCGPNRPWTIITTASANSGSCITLREWRQRRKRPSTGTRSQSPFQHPGASALTPWRRRGAGPRRCSACARPPLLDEEHVVVHGDHHRDEHQRVVDQVELDAGDPELRDARRHRPVEQVVPDDDLPLQQRVLDVVPELNDQGHVPPGPRGAGEPGPQQPDAEQHHHGVGVVEHLGLDQPGVPEPQDPERLRDGPFQHVDLKRLRQVLGPMAQHHHHEDLQGPLVPFRVQALPQGAVEVGHGGGGCEVHRMSFRLFSHSFLYRCDPDAKESPPGAPSPGPEMALILLVTSRGEGARFPLFQGLLSSKRRMRNAA